MTLSIRDPHMRTALPDGTNRKLPRMAPTAIDRPGQPLHSSDHRTRSAGDAAIPRTWAAVVFAVLALGATAAEKPVPADHAARMAASQQLFARTVRPWLEKNCLECHGGAKVKSDFNLSSRELLLKGGDKGVAVLPGRGASSALVKYIAHEETPHMPPKKPAAPADIVAAVTRWIDLGAAYDRPLGAVTAAKKPLTVTDEDRDYWAYRPLQRVPLPAVKDSSWPRTPLDQFLLAKMEARGVTPVPAAERRTLVRRLYFDLIGLPPRPQEIEAVIAAPDFETAWEALVDRLLASPHLGERWARHWLDPARFAESHDFEHDYPRPFAYHYRDFVIRAFNRDLPYDQFVLWQIASDELAPNDLAALVATGFLGVIDQAIVDDGDLTVEAPWRPDKQRDKASLYGSEGRSGRSSSRVAAVSSACLRRRRASMSTTCWSAGKQCTPSTPKRSFRPSSIASSNPSRSPSALPSSRARRSNVVT
jgi:hypothetical protein